MKTSFRLFIVTFLIYFVIDVAYNLAIGMDIDHYYFSQSGVLAALNTQPAYPATFLIFFILISYANVRLVIIPAIAKNSVKESAISGFVLGLTAYATMALPMLWQIKGFPFQLTIIHILSGGLLSLITASLTTYVHLKYW